MGANNRLKKPAKSRLLILLAIWSYVGWFGCIYSAQKNGGAVALLFPLVSWTIFFLCFGLDKKMFFRLGVLLAVGLTFDSAMAASQLIATLPPAEFGLIPIWLVSMWLLFASSLPLFAQTLSKRLFLAAVLGAVFGPLSYQAGEKFSVLQMNGLFAVFIYALFWALFFPGAAFWLRLGETTDEDR